MDIKHRVLRCAKYKWLTGNNVIKKINILRSEITRRELYIKHRTFFETAEECNETGDYEDMGE